MMCKHKRTSISQTYYIDYMLCEHLETCDKCGASRYFAYGKYDKWNTCFNRVIAKLKSVINTLKNKNTKDNDLPF